MESRLLPLMGIISVSWLLIFIGSYIIFKPIAHIPDLLPGRIGIYFTAAVKALLSIILVGIWILIMVKLRNLYVSRRLLKKP